MKNLVETIELQAINPESLAGKRLDKILAILFPDYSRTQLQAWVRTHAVCVDQIIHTQPNARIKAGAYIEVHGNKVTKTSYCPQAIALNILYEDDSLLVINKQAGLVVHPGSGNPDQTLLNALLHHVPQAHTLPRAGIVHRLDKNTSGLMIAAKTLTAHTDLVRQLQKREITREYSALVEKRMIAGGTVEAPIDRHPTQRTKMTVAIHKGKSARTHYRIIERFHQHTWLKITLETGRTHQIRVHMAHIHHALLGDPVYSGRLRLPAHATLELTQALRVLYQQQRPALHAQALIFKHPHTQVLMKHTAPIPNDMQTLIELLRLDNTWHDD